MRVNNHCIASQKATKRPLGLKGTYTVRPHGYRPMGFIMDPKESPAFFKKMAGVPTSPNVGRGSLDGDPFLCGSSLLMQMYGEFEGFPFFYVHCWGW